VVWLVFLFFFFFFFFFFFSSFFSSASLGRRRGKDVRRKISQGLRMLQEYSRGVVLNPPPLAWEGRGQWRRRRRFASWLLAMGSPHLGPPAGVFIIELGVALCLQASQAPLLQVSRGRRIGISTGGLVRQGRFIGGGVQKYHGTLRTPPAGHPLARFGAVVIKIFRGLKPRSPRHRVLFWAGRWCARKRAVHDAVSKKWTPGVELQDPGRDAAGLPSA
jgi:hypothetical protein